ncbi:MAG: ExbD/TolR family protein [Phycisphaerales bacterium]
MSAGARTFRRRGALDLHRTHFGPNMTPMVDVVMVILVFFMVSAAFVGPEWFLRSMVPRPVASADAPKQPTPPKPNPGVVAPDQSEMKLTKNQIYLRLILPEGGGPPSVVWLSKRFESIEAFAAALARFTEGENIPKKDIEVFIEPSKDVPYREVIKLHETCEAYGIGRIGVIVR